jgi:hypothetical protein
VVQVGNSIASLWPSLLPTQPAPGAQQFCAEQHALSAIQADAIQLHCLAAGGIIGTTNFLYEAEAQVAKPWFFTWYVSILTTPGICNHPPAQHIKA